MCVYIYIYNGLYLSMPPHVDTRLYELIWLYIFCLPEPFRWNMIKFNITISLMGLQ